jgi:predicted P-loop ATPase
VFIATVNEGGYLKDSTGGRRFWPLELRKPINIEKIEQDRNQLWAEAAMLEDLGVSDVLPRELWALAGEHQAEQTSVDPWADTIRAFLERRRRDYDRERGLAEREAESVPLLPPGRIHTSELFTALEIKPADQTKDKAQRLRTVMESTLRWRHRRGVRVCGRTSAGYVRDLDE